MKTICGAISHTRARMAFQAANVPRISQVACAPATTLLASIISTVGFLLLLSGLAASVRGQDVASNNGPTNSWFAKYLMTHGEYYRAQTEYMRLLAAGDHPDSAAVFEKRIAECFLYGGRWVDLERSVDKLLESDHRPDRTELVLMRAEAKLRLHRFESATEDCESLLGSQPDWLNQRANFLAGIGHIHLSEWDLAVSRFNESGIASDYARLAPLGHDLPHKSAGLARALGILPGLGYLYTGHSQTALAALLVNGLCALGTVSAFDDGNISWGVLGAFVTVGWYSGSIYGAGVSAERINLAARNDFLSQFDW